MEATLSASSDLGSWPRYNEAVLGFRNYWYPVMFSNRLRRRPNARTTRRLSECGVAMEPHPHRAKSMNTRLIVAASASLGLAVLLLSTRPAQTAQAVPRAYADARTPISTLPYAISASGSHCSAFHWRITSLKPNFDGWPYFFTW